jgi:hypothetical protein
MIKVNSSLTINPAWVASLEIDSRYYMNGPGVPVLIIRMHDGYEHRITHEPFFLGGANIYDLEKRISEALAPASPISSPA